MSIFDTKTLDEALVRKEREMVVDDLLELALEQIKAASEIGLTQLTISFNPLWEKVTTDDIIRHMNYMPYLKEFVAKLRDEDFDVDRAYDVSDGIHVSWTGADNFGTKASKMWRLSKDDYSVENSNILYKIKREILRNIDTNGKAKAIIPYDVFGCSGMPYAESERLNLLVNEPEAKSKLVYKYIKEYESEFEISTTEDGVMIKYKG